MMPDADDVKALLSVLHDVMNSWIAALVLFLFVSSALIVEYLPLEDVKLSSMNMKTLLLIIWLFSLMVIIVKGLSGIMRKYRSRKEEQATKRRALNFVLALPLAEQSLLKYIYQSPVGAVYLPYDDPAAIRLWKEGALRRVVNVVFQRKNTGCFLYELLPQLRELLTATYPALNWSTLLPTDRMNDYQ